MTDNEEIRLDVGDKAPDFTLPDSAGNQHSLSEHRGEHVVVYFYPAAGTPGCTRQACDFRDNLAALNNAGYRVLGISPDNRAKLAKFVEAERLSFPLLSDPDKSVLGDWGTFGAKKNYGKVVQGVIRSTFVVDPEGTIARAQYNVRASGHVARIMRDLGVES